MDFRSLSYFSKDVRISSVMCVRLFYTDQLARFTFTKKSPNKIKTNQSIISILKCIMIIVLFSDVCESFILSIFLMF